MCRKAPNFVASANNARCDGFVGACQEHLPGQVGPIDLSTGVVTGLACREMVNRRDLWALITPHVRRCSRYRRAASGGSLMLALEHFG